MKLIFQFKLLSAAHPATVSLLVEMSSKHPEGFCWETKHTVSQIVIM